MKYFAKKTTAFILTLIILISIIPSSMFSVYAINEECETLFENAIKNKDASVQFPVKVDASEFINEFIARNPEYFYVNLSDCAFWTSGRVDIAYYNYTDEQITAFNEKVAYIASLTDGMSTYTEKILFIHEYLMENCDYDNTLKKHTCYNCLMEGSAVCEGYAQALVCIFHKLNYDCALVTSDINNHAWNLVKLNGKWYYIDVTHDDTLGKKHINLLISGTKCASQDHKTCQYVNGGKGDWKINGVTDCTELYNNTDYDTAFWQNAVNIMNYYNGVWYYTDGLDIYSCKYGTAPKKITSHNKDDYYWNVVGGTKYYIGDFSDVVVCNGRLFYSTENTIRAVNLDGTGDELMYTLSDNEYSTGRIYDLKVEGTKVYYYLAESSTKAFNYSSYIDGTASHKHIMTDWTVKSNSTCKVNGVEERSCTVKGCTYKEQRNIDLLPHDYGEWLSVKDAGCTEKGVERRTCKSCQTYEERETEALNHNYGEIIHVQTPDCVNAGLDIQICSRCKEVKEIPVSVLEHSFGEWTETKKATCVETGEKTRTCTRCEETETAVIPLTDHNFGEWETTVAATCTEAGEETRKCAECKKTETRTVKAKGHSFGKWIITRKATCYVEGLKERTCPDCKKYETQTIEKTKHNYSDWQTVTPATCSTEGIKVKKCSNCGDEISAVIPVTEHNFTEWNIETEATCTQTGLKKRVCTLCKTEETEEIPCTEHNVEQWYNASNSGNILGGLINTEYLNGYPVPTCYSEGKEHGTCTVCGQEIDRVIPKLEHNFEVDIISQPTCTKDGTGYRHCTNSFCFYSKKEIITIPALGHTCESWEVTKKVTCLENGEETGYCTVCQQNVTRVIETTGHEYSEWKVTEQPTCIKQGTEKRVCKKCGDMESNILETTDHNYGDWIYVKMPTCTAEGKVTRVCSVCNDTQSKSVDKIDHDFSEWTVSVQASCETVGYKTRTCSMCKKTEKTEIPALEHNFSDWTVTKTVSCTQSGEESRTCSICKKVETKEIKAQGHTFTDWEITDDGTAERECTLCGEKETKDADYLIGDANSDSKVNTKDARKILRAVAKLDTLTETETKAADVNKDGKINTKDARVILRYVAKLINALIQN